MSRELNVATCQFPVSRNIENNLSFILKLATTAKKNGADIVHFSEGCLSGYAGFDFDSFAQQDEGLLQRSLSQIAELAARQKIWVIVGSHYYARENKRPYNCLWLIDDSGALSKRYDKRICMGNPGELEHFYYKPGRIPVQFTIKGIQCGLLICHEWRYPELYREQHQLGTELLFQSWYDGNLTAGEYEAEGKALGSLIVGTVRGRAANSQLWISASNTSKRQSCFASFLVQPDGTILNQLKRNVTGIMVNRIKLDKAFVDPSGPWRDRVIRGIYHSGELK